MGLPHHEWRSPDIQHIDTKRWLGNHNISGKTIMLGIDGGYGDAIQFCRYVPMVKALGADIILYVPSDLFALMRNMPATITDRIAAPFDLSCPLQSLPLAFKTELHSIPNSCPYLSAPTPIVQEWAHRMKELPRPRIGLCWSGHPTHKNDRNRSMAFADLRPMFEVKASFISLKNELSGEIGQLTESPVIDYRTLLIDFAQTAALIENLDLVITVDTSIAHLAGALGKPTWIMLPYTPDWRWMLDRDDSPWYPTARLFRQDSSRRWDGVVARVATELRCHQGHSREKPTGKSKETDERHQEPILGSGS
jgi:hypothetical protein